MFLETLLQISDRGIFKYLMELYEYSSLHLHKLTESFDSSIFHINMCLDTCYLGNKNSDPLATRSVKAKHKKYNGIKGHGGREPPIPPQVPEVGRPLVS